MPYVGSVNLSDCDAVTLGKWHTVEACDGHGADLDAVRRIAGAAPVPLRITLEPLKRVGGVWCGGIVAFAEMRRFKGTGLDSATGWVPFGYDAPRSSRMP